MVGATCCEKLKIMSHTKTVNMWYKKIITKINWSRKINMLIVKTNHKKMEIKDENTHNLFINFMGRGTLFSTIFQDFL